MLEKTWAPERLPEEGSKQYLRTPGKTVPTTIIINVSLCDLATVIGSYKE
jgi:hypothetical protein